MSALRIYIFKILIDWYCSNHFDVLCSILDMLMNTKSSFCKNNVSGKLVINLSIGTLFLLHHHMNIVRGWNIHWQLAGNWRVVCTLMVFVFILQRLRPASAGQVPSSPLPSKEVRPTPRSTRKSPHSSISESKQSTDVENSISVQNSFLADNRISEVMKKVLLMQPK